MSEYTKAGRAKAVIVESEYARAGRAEAVMSRSEYARVGNTKAVMLRKELQVVQFQFRVLIQRRQVKSAGIALK